MEIRAGGGDFCQLHGLGLMDFIRYGAITSQPLQAAETGTSAAHDAGFAVMTTPTKRDTVRAAASLGG